MLFYRFHCLCFISFPSVHTSLIKVHFYFPQYTIHLIHFIYHCSSRPYLSYLVALTLHGHSRLLSVSLFTQSPLWKLTTYDCRQINFQSQIGIRCLKLNSGDFTTLCLFILNKKAEITAQNTHANGLFVGDSSMISRLISVEKNADVSRTQCVSSFVILGYA